MASYHQIYYQNIFSTKYRLPTITESNCQDLYRYIIAIIKNKNCKPYFVNGTEDHIHIFSNLHSTVCLADFVKTIKVATSIWMKECGLFPNFKEWQTGYGAFTYNHTQFYTILNYVKNQKQHHYDRSSKAEFLTFLFENGVEFDEKYFE